MNGNLMYEIARQRVAERQQAAREASQARALRAAARARRHARDTAAESVAAPVIPDYAHEMFEGARDAVPTPRQEDERGRHTRSGR
jgi:hypothetical protein